MKVGLVLERFDPQRGGLEHWTWQFARSLAARGHEIHVVAFEFHPEARGDRVNLHPMAETPRSPLARAELLAARLPAMGFEIVHDMGIGWEADVIQPHAGSTIALWEHNLMRIPRWRQIRFWREKRYRELAEIERRQHRQSSAIIVPVSRMVARNFTELHQLRSDRMRVIHNGVDVERFTPASRAALRAATRRELGVGEAEVLFLMLAHNLLLKNAETVVRAGAQLVAAGLPVRVLIAGGKKPEPFSRLAGQLGAAHAIAFLPSVESVPAYAAADVYVQPTWYDPCSLVTLEAAACGLPVITTRFNGASELMTEGGEGFVLDDPADVRTLAMRMRELLDPALRERMGRAGRALMMAHTFEQQTTKFLELYEKVGKERRQRA